MSRRYDHDQDVWSIGGIPIHEAAEPLEHLTEIYDPGAEEAEDGQADEQ